MKIKQVTQYLESIAPPMYQESYDNAGLIVGDANQEVKGVLLCLDSTEAIVEEAIKLKCNLIIAHHPIVFKGLKRFNGKNYVERTVIKAIKNDIAIYAIHTNLDNVYHQGVNAKIAEKLGLTDTEILAPKSGLKKLVAYVNPNYSEAIRSAILGVGAGSFNGLGKHSFTSVGVSHEHGQGKAEVRIEVSFPSDLQSAVVKALRDNDPAEFPAYEITSIENLNSELGAGMIGYLPKPMPELVFLEKVKNVMKAGVIRHTGLLNKPIKKVALCGGSGGFLLNHAKRKGADVFITADYKYHEFFDADGQIVIADIGHYESEQYTIELLHSILSQKFSIFAAHCTKINTNPVNYL